MIPCLRREIVVRDISKGKPWASPHELNVGGQLLWTLLHWRQAGYAATMGTNSQVDVSHRTPEVHTRNVERERADDHSDREVRVTVRKRVGRLMEQPGTRIASGCRCVGSPDEPLHMPRASHGLGRTSFSGRNRDFASSMSSSASVPSAVSSWI